MQWSEKFKAWLNQETTGPKKFFQISILIVGGLVAMGLGVGLVAIILIASPLLTVLILIFLLIYGIASLIRGKSS